MSVTNLTAVAVSTTEIDLSVTADNPFDIDSSPDGSTWTSLVTGQTSSPYQHTGLSPSQRVYYRCTDDAGANYAYSDAYTLPAVPTGLTASTADSGKVSLAWDAASGAASYVVLRSYDGGRTTTTLTQTCTGTSYDDTGVKVGNLAQYRVRSAVGSDAGVSSSPSDPATGLRPLSASHLPALSAVESSATTIDPSTLLPGASGTASGGIDPANIVSASFVVTGHNNYVGGSAGSYPTTASSQASQLATDQAAVLAKAAYIDSSQTILSQQGTLDLSNLTTGNIADGVTIGAVEGTFTHTADYQAKTASILLSAIFQSMVASGTTLHATSGNSSVVGTFTHTSDYTANSDIAASIAANYTANTDVAANYTANTLSVALFAIPTDVVVSGERIEATSGGGYITGTAPSSGGGITTVILII